MKARFFQKVIKDDRFRIKSFSCVSLTFCAAYSAFLFFIAVANSSRWFLVTSLYYALLCAARIFAFAQMKPKRKPYAKMKFLRACGWFLLLINVAVSLMSFVLINDEQRVRYHEITVIALATYTFGALALSIVGGVKCFKRDSYSYSCAKLIGLVSSGVSFITLTNTMLFVFGEQDTQLRGIMMPLVSAAVSVFIILSAAFAVRRANGELRILKDEKE